MNTLLNILDTTYIAIYKKLEVLGFTRSERIILASYLKKDMTFFKNTVEMLTDPGFIGLESKPIAEIKVFAAKYQCDTSIFINAALPALTSIQFRFNVLQELA